MFFPPPEAVVVAHQQARYPALRLSLHRSSSSRSRGSCGQHVPVRFHTRLQSCSGQILVCLDALCSVEPQSHDTASRLQGGACRGACGPASSLKGTKCRMSFLSPSLILVRSMVWYPSGKQAFKILCSTVSRLRYGISCGRRTCPGPARAVKP
jgi:hypothetical protein